MPRVIIDGYNLLLRTGRGAGEDSRSELARMAATYRGPRNVEIVVVFDSRSGSAGPPPSAPAGVRIEFARGDADSHILDLVRRSSAPRDLLVVTSDRRLAEQARDLGARVEAVEAFTRRAGTRSTADPAAPERAKLPAREVEEWERLFRARRPDDEF